MTTDNETEKTEEVVEEVTEEVTEAVEETQEPEEIVAATEPAQPEPAVKDVEGLQKYEMTVIFKPNLEESAQNTLLGNLHQMITGRGGVISKVDNWGKKRLAYPIKHNLEGYYVLTHFQAEPAVNKVLESSLRITEEVIRFLIIKL